MTMYDSDTTCSSMITDIEDYEEYDEISGVGTILAVNRYLYSISYYYYFSLVTQIKKTIYDVCDSYSSFEAFTYQCPVVISEAGIMLVLEDDEVETICDDIMDLTDCETASWTMSYYYYTDGLKSALSSYGYFMIEDNYDDKLDTIETLLEALANSTTSSDSTTDTSDDSTDDDSTDTTDDSTETTSDSSDNSTDSTTDTSTLI